MMKSNRKDLNYVRFLNRLDAPTSEKLGLISLICYITQKMRSKDKDYKVTKTLENILGKDYTNNSQDFLINLSELCEDFLDTKYTQFDNCGLKDYKSMFKAVKDILHKEIPFHNYSNEDSPF